MQPSESDIQPIKEQLNSLASEIATFTIRKEADLKVATGHLLDAKKAGSLLKARKDALLKPANETVKQIRSLFAPLEKQLAEFEENIKSAMVKYQKQVEARAERQTQKIEAKVDSGEMDMVSGMAKLTDVKQAPKTMHSENGSVSFKTIKKIGILDVHALPKKYFERIRVKEALRLELLEDYRNGNPIPSGAEVYEEKVVAGRV